MLMDLKMKMCPAKFLFDNQWWKNKVGKAVRDAKQQFKEVIESKYNFIT